ncbi:unnamed protein product [Allacma fusca]|uniref:ATP-dependent DNA helicase n=1 Tax=Allacma fusca TaxID=39272 RepID=A0A8J2KAA6_9HEXA|nr:unnamed protein product [Allacma fusca]
MPNKDRVRRERNRDYKDKLRSPTKKEEEVDKTLKRLKRHDPIQKKMQGERNAQCQKKEDQIQRKEQEQARNTVQHRETRSNPKRRTELAQMNSRSRKRARTNPDFLDHERALSSAAKRVTKNCRTFEMQIFSKEKLIEECGNEFIQKINSIESDVLRKTCLTSVKKKQIPKLAVFNGFKFPIIPEVLNNLTPLEERLCALRIPFMQIRSLGVGRQIGLKGNIVNIVNPINDIAKVLPRRFSETCTTQLKFMRNIRNEHPYMYETIRPLKVYNACKYLSTRPAYEEENFELVHEWQDRTAEDVENFIVPENPGNDVTMESVDLNLANPSTSESNEGCSDDEDEVNPGSEETLLQAEDINEGVKYAPGQNQVPLSLLRDKNAEILSFPKIYCGELRILNANNKYTFADIAKSEIRRFDRRACDPPHLLYVYKILQMQRIFSSVSTQLRMKKLGKVTAANVSQEEFVNNMIQHDEAFQILRGIRSAPQFWESQKKDLMAMLRTLGIPTFFISMSAAEIQWNPLIVHLIKLLENLNITELEGEQMSWEKKAELIRNDPVTCSRYFDYRFRTFFNVLLKPGMIFNQYELLDFYWRVEFQHRGSPHIHMLIFLKNSPKLDDEDPSSYQRCEEFIHQFITCENDEDLARYQIHHHTHSCRRFRRTKERKAARPRNRRCKLNSNETCRFNYPIPPMRSCKILKPHEDLDNQTTIELKNKLKIIKSSLEDIRINRSNITFDEFLREQNLSDEEYIDIVRVGINRSTVFLARTPTEAFINSYNKRMTTAWRANLDIQFVCDGYACAKYIAQYINKSNTGISKLLRQALKEIKNGNLILKDKLQKMGSCFVNGMEVCCQEAAYAVLSMPVCNSSRETVFIQTGEPSQRVFLLKPENQIANLDPDSTDIIVPGLLNHYANRPEELRNVCLAVFASEYEYSKSKKNRLPEMTETDKNEAENSCSTKLLPLKNNSGYVRKRTTGKFIRYRRYSALLDKPNYFREMCMLFFPWASEKNDLLDKDCEAVYMENTNFIEEMRKQFDPFTNYDVYVEAQNLADAEEEENEVNEANLSTSIDAEFRSFFDSNTDVNMFDISPQNTSGKRNDLNVQRFTPQNLIPNHEFIESVRTLNIKQRQYFQHIMRNIRYKKRGICEFVSGGAGVGKSHLINCIVQAVLRYYLSIPGVDAALTPILLCSPTGRAAFLINGQTNHSLFMFPLNQSSISALDASTRNTLYTQFREVVLVIMDEVSMCGSRQLGWIDQRLRDVFGSQSTDSFALINVVLFGDLHQLPPIGSKVVFESPGNGLSFLAGPVLWQKFKFFELTEIMRQKGEV